MQFLVSQMLKMRKKEELVVTKKPVVWKQTNKAQLQTLKEQPQNTGDREEQATTE